MGPVARTRCALWTHLVLVLGCLSLTAYCVRLLIEEPPFGLMVLWFGAAAVGHDLVLLPLMALGDRTLTAVSRRRRRRPAGISAVNHVRAPLLGSGLLFLVFFPGIVRQGTASHVAATGFGQQPYFTRWLWISGVLVAISVVVYALRLLAHSLRKEGPRGMEAAAAGSASVASIRSDRNAMHVLVTGGAGFIGSHIADLLAAEGHKVRLLDSLLPAAHEGGDVPSYLESHELVRTDLREPEGLARALSDVDAVCHQAAMVGLETAVSDMPGYVAHNDLGTARLLSVMAEQHITRLVLASSMVVYGEGWYSCPIHAAVRPGPRAIADLDEGAFDPRCPECGSILQPDLVPEEAPVDPRNTYATTKVTQEHLAAAWARHTGGSAVALRYHNVYGPRMPRNTPYAGVGSIFRSALANGQAPQVFEDGGQRRDFVHARDVARANLAGLTHAGPGFRAYNVCSGQPRTIGDMARALSRSAGGPRPVVTGQYRLGDVRHIVADPRRAETELGFRAQIDFEDGMVEFGTGELRH